MPKEEKFGYHVLCERYGVVELSQLGPELLDTYRGKLPDYLLDIWQTHGLTSHSEGFLQFVNPAQYRPVVKAFGFDPQQFIPFAMNSFGVLYCWNGEYVYQLNPYLGDMFLSARIPLDSFFAFGFISKSSQELKLHQKLVKKLGQPGKGELFARLDHRSPLDHPAGIKKLEAIPTFGQLSKTENEDRTQ